MADPEVTALARELCPVWRTAAPGHHHDPCDQCLKAQAALVHVVRRSETESTILREVASHYREIAVQRVQSVAQGKGSAWARKVMASTKEMAREVSRRLGEE